MILKKICLPLLFALAFTGCNQGSDTNVEADAVGSGDATVAQSEARADANVQSESNLPDSAPSYTLVLDNSYPPFSFKDEYGNATGFEVDLLTAAGEEAGFKVSAVPLPWEGIFENLESGNADIVGGVSVTPERKAAYEMAEPHVVTDLVFAYKGTEKPYEELLTGKISAQENTSFIDILREIPEIDESQILGQPTSFMAFRNMLVGETDAVFNNRAILTYQLSSVEDQSSVEDVNFTPLPDADDIMAFTVKKGNKELLNEINEGLDKIRANGKFDEIEQKWFGTDEL